MNTQTAEKIENFFINCTNHRVPSPKNFKAGLIAYWRGFIFTPEIFDIAESARVDAGVTLEEMKTWMELHRETIEDAEARFEACFYPLSREYPLREVQPSW